MILDAVTKFIFKCPSYMIDSKSATDTLNYDSDDDLDVDRDREGIILIGIKVLFHVSECRSSLAIVQSRD